jgi:hypothetical protein
MCIVTLPKELVDERIDREVLAERAGQIFDDHWRDVFEYLAILSGYDEAHEMLTGVFWLWAKKHGSENDYRENARLECLKIARRAVMMHKFGHEDEEMKEAVITMRDPNLGLAPEEELARLADVMRDYEGLDWNQMEILVLRLHVGLSSTETAGVIGVDKEVVIAMQHEGLNREVKLQQVGSISAVVAAD